MFHLKKLNDLKLDCFKVTNVYKQKKLETVKIVYTFIALVKTIFMYNFSQKYTY